MRVEVEKLTNTTDSVMSKMEQVFAVVQGLDIGGVVKIDGKGIHKFTYLCYTFSDIII